jgi:hypothetical protein
MVIISKQDGFAQINRASKRLQPGAITPQTDATIAKKVFGVVPVPVFAKVQSWLKITKHPFPSRLK